MDGGHGRREHHRLTVSGHGFEHAQDLGQKPQVEHVIRFVEYQNFDRIESQIASFEVVPQSSWSGYHDVGIAGERPNLWTHLDPTDQASGVESMVLADNLEEGLGL